MIDEPSRKQRGGKKHKRNQSPGGEKSEFRISDAVEDEVGGQSIRGESRKGYQRENVSNLRRQADAQRGTQERQLKCRATESNGRGVRLILHLERIKRGVDRGQKKQKIRVLISEKGRSQANQNVG